MNAGATKTKGAHVCPAPLEHFSWFQCVRFLSQCYVKSNDYGVFRRLWILRSLVRPHPTVPFLPMAYAKITLSLRLYGSCRLHLDACRTVKWQYKRKVCCSVPAADLFYMLNGFQRASAVCLGNTRTCNAMSIFRYFLASARTCAGVTFNISSRVFLTTSAIEDMSLIWEIMNNQC